MVRVEKITDDTYKDLQEVRQLIVEYGTKNLPSEVQPTIRLLKDDVATYQGIIAVAVKFLKVTLEHLTIKTSIKREAKL